MQVTRLDIANLRCFERASLTPGPGMNLITGANGAGKTSVLEALHLMAYGRSFRGRVHDGLIRGGASALEVFIEWREGARPDPTGSTQASASERMHRAGLRHEGQAWVGRLDGADVAHLGELCAAFAVVTAEPGSHALITGGGEPRRRRLHRPRAHPGDPGGRKPRRKERDVSRTVFRLLALFGALTTLVLRAAEEMAAG